MAFGAYFDSCNTTTRVFYSSISSQVLPVDAEALVDAEAREVDAEGPLEGVVVEV